MYKNFSTCRMCGARDDFDALNIREMMFGSGDEFLYERCNYCRSLQIKEIPINLDRYYPEHYSGWTSAGKKRLKQKIRTIIVREFMRAYLSDYKIIRSIAPSPKRGDLLALREADVRKKDKILDVGCGKDPFLLRLLSELGFVNLTGADPFLLEEKIIYDNIRLLKRDLRSIDETFDIVTLNHSLEHTVDPQKNLIDIARVLKPEGRAVVRLPTPSSKAYEDYGVDWVQLDAPRHLNLPSRQAMQKMVERAGLKIRKTFDDSGELQFYGSELIKKGISLSSPGARNQFSRSEMKKFSEMAAKLNNENRGDQVCYIISH